MTITKIGKQANCSGRKELECQIDEELNA